MTTYKIISHNIGRISSRIIYFGQNEQLFVEIEWMPAVIANISFYI